MARKQILTNDNILTDVKNILERPATLSYAEHKKANFPLLVISAVMLIAMVIFQNYYKFILLIGLIFIAAYIIVDFCNCWDNQIRYKKRQTVNCVN